MTSMRIVGLAIIGGVFLGTTAALGCGGVSSGVVEAPDATDTVGTVAPYLPPGAVAYARLDLDALRASAHAERVLGWYRTFVPAIPGFETEHAGVQAFEQLVARTQEVAAAVFAPREALVADDAPRGNVEGAEEGLLVLLRTDVGLDWVAHQAAVMDRELVRRTRGGRPALVSVDPTGDQLMVVEMGRGVLAMGVGGLDPVAARLDVVRRRMDGDATALADPAAADLLGAVGGESAPLAVVGRVPPALAAGLATGMQGDRFQVRGLEDLKGAALRIDPSRDLETHLLLRMAAPEGARMVAADLATELRRRADDALVLLLGLDLWIEHTDVRARGRDVHAAMRLPEQDLRTWFFHVERLAAAAKAFLTEGGPGGVLGGLFSDGVEGSIGSPTGPRESPARGATEPRTPSEGPR